jgi:proline racemase
MTSRQNITAIDVHAAGEPGRVLMGSHLLVKGADMAEKLQYCQENLEGLRRLVLREPRGYPGLCGVLVLPPVNPDSDFGMIVLEQGGFAPMSGANLICAVTALVETQALAVTGVELLLKIDTAAGVVEARAEVEDGRVTNVSIDNVPAFVVALDHVLELPEYGRVPVDIVFGGQFYVQASDAALGLDLETSSAKEIIRAATVLRLAAQQDFPVLHPLLPNIDQIGLPMIYGASTTVGVHGRNAVVLPNGEANLSDPSSWDAGTLDRSPCGTGTCGRMAALHARGQLGLNEAFVHESMLGTTFTGRLRGLSEVGELPGVLPTLEGRGWITGFHQFVLDSDDPFSEGYTVGDIWGATTATAPEPNSALA